MLLPFFVWQNKALLKINPENVMALETEKNYTKVHLSDRKTHLVRSTLSSALKKLPEDMFIKTHRSYAVSIYYIDKINRDHIIIGKKSVPIARAYYKSVIAQLNIIE